LASPYTLTNIKACFADNGWSLDSLYFTFSGPSGETVISRNPTSGTCRDEIDIAFDSDNNQIRTLISNSKVAGFELGPNSLQTVHDSGCSSSTCLSGFLDMVTFAGKIKGFYCK
jgi:hypothetical protein